VKGTNQGHADSPVRDRSWFKSKAGRKKEFLLMLDEHWSISCCLEHAIGIVGLTLARKFSVV
jgi:hypothetical protein